MDLNGMILQVNLFLGGGYFEGGRLTSHKRRDFLLVVETESYQAAIPKGNDRLPTIHFQVRTASFREGIHQYAYTV